MPAFGESSTKRLNTCHPNIKIICNEAIKYIDFSIVTGHRSKEKQDALYPVFTKVKWPNSKHNSFPSVAVDVAPYIKPYGTIFGNSEQLEEIMELRGISKTAANNFVLKSYARLIGYMEAIAHSKNIKIRVGIDWDGDFDMTDQTFHDLGHWELTL
jgi:peptidoglycan L-alanyl-D-glutamate endopeptidase CwlK